MMAGQAGGFLLVLAVVLPIAALLLGLALGGRWAARAALGVMPLGTVVSFAVAIIIGRTGEPLGYVLGGWPPPLGVTLRADGLSAVMLAATALLIGGIGAYAHAGYRRNPDASGSRASTTFWLLLLALWGALDLVFVGGDLFNLYVALELLTFGAVPLVCLDGSAETLTAALRYLLFALIGSVLYLLGVALLFGVAGTLDIALLPARILSDRTAAIAIALMTAGLLAKTALWPLHLWLPPAHAGAPAAASAILSALVVKAPYFIIIRLWFDVMPALLSRPAASVLGLLGAGAVLSGSVLALRQQRLKLLIAYSTVAQIGYLFVLFPLAAAAGATVWIGGAMQLLSHTFAKSAMFIGAGLIAQDLGHDRIADLRGIARSLPVTAFALGLAGLSLMGLPPSGGFVAKWLLLSASVSSGQWWWSLVMLAGGLLAGGYIFRILIPALAGGVAPPPPQRGTRPGEAIALALALCSVLLGVLPLGLFGLLQVGRPHTAQVAHR